MKRNTKEIGLLFTGTDEIKFFENLNNDYGPNTHFECCKKMTYQKLEKKNVLFETGNLKKSVNIKKQIPYWLHFYLSNNCKRTK